MKKFSGGDVGNWVRVRYSDVGVRDELIVSVSDDRLTAQTIPAFPQADEEGCIEASQVLLVGPKLTAPKF